MNFRFNLPIIDRKKKNNIKIYLYYSFIYLIIFLQYPFGLSIGKFIFNLDLASNIQPSYLLMWGLVRMFIVLPLIFTLVTLAEKDEKSLFLQIGEKNKMLSLTFWGTLIFTFIGIFLYPFFINQSTLSLEKFFFLFPIFSLFSISNAFVEEVFFRGVSLTVLTERFSFWQANFLQAILFAAIHFINPMSQNIALFVILTFFLGLIWGWITKSTKSLIPAIILHIIADFFVAISLF